MKFLVLLIKHARRNRRRTALTALSVALAVFLFTSLRALLGGFHAAVEASSSTRLVTTRSTSLMFQLPLSHLDVIKGVRGVRHVTWASWFGGVYKDPSNFFAQFAIDPVSYLTMYPEIVLSAAERQAFLDDRVGAIVGDGLATRFGFNVGDRIVLQVGIPYYGELDYSFTVRGIYRSSSAAVDNQSMFFHWKYLDERSVRPGQVGWYVEQLEDPNLAQRVSATVDERFANSPYETRTETEKAFQAGFVSMMGNLNLLLGGISLAVIITTLFVAGNTMAMSVRERTVEIAVMRTLGFPPRTIFLLVAGEAVTISIAGGIIGALAAAFLVSGNQLAATAFVPPFHVTARDAGMGIVVAAVVGVLAGLLPAVAAARLKVVDALRRVA